MSAKNSSLERLSKQDIERFWSRVDKEGPILRVELGSCWIWTGQIQEERGYGLFKAKGATLAAHRISYYLHYEHPRELNVLHRCDNPPCVRPQHLFRGNHADNVADRHCKGRDSKGSKMWKSIFTEAQVLGIRDRLNAGERQADIAKELNTSRHTIYCIDHRITWKHI